MAHREGKKGKTILSFFKPRDNISKRHNNVVKSMDALMDVTPNALMDVTRHADKVIIAQTSEETSEEIQKNRLLLTTTIESIRWLVFQACALRDRDDSGDSKNLGNFIELMKFMGKWRDDIDNVVLEKSLQDAKYTSPMIQKEILHIFANKVRNKIREEVGDAKFSIIVDEVKDESNREQIAIILRFVDVDGFLRERFFEIVHVSDTTAAALRQEIFDVLSCFNLKIQNMRGQAYDGASNLRGAWKGLQALILRDCPYAHYIHCFTHRLELAFVAAAQDEFSIWLFFSKLTSIVNFVIAYLKRFHELQSVHAIETMVATGKCVTATGRGVNQIDTLHQDGAIRWSSNFDSVWSLIDMYGATCTVLQSFIVEGSTQSIRGEAADALKAMKSFEFIFILHLMFRILGITDLFCKALKLERVYISSVMGLVSSTRKLLQTLRQDGWDNLIMRVESFCRDNDIDIPEMGAHYKGVCSRQEIAPITVEHHYRINIFNAAIDHQLMELNTRFNDGVVELLILSSALEPMDGFKSFKIDDICNLAEKFYPDDFTEQDVYWLRRQLQYYEIDVLRHKKFQNMSTISELCRGLIETNKSQIYTLIDRLIRLVLTLPVSTATTERACSGMKLIKSALRNKTGDEFLADSMVLYVEKELAENIDSDSIIDDFYSLQDCRV